MVSCIQSVELWLCRICHSFKDLFQRNLMMLIDKHNHRHNVILTQGSIFSFRKWSGIAPCQSNEVLLVFHFYLSGRIVVVLFRYWNFHVFNNTLNYLFPILRNRQAFKAANICRLMPRFMFFYTKIQYFFVHMHWNSIIFVIFAAVIVVYLIEEFRNRLQRYCKTSITSKFYD